MMYRLRVPKIIRVAGESVGEGVLPQSIGLNRDELSEVRLGPFAVDRILIHAAPHRIDQPFGVVQGWRSDVGSEFLIPRRREA